MQRVVKFVRWCKPRVLDGLRALGEAGVAFACACAWILVPVIKHMLDTPDVEFLDAARAMANKHFEPTHALKYVTGILASSTAYIWCRRAGLRNYTSRLAFLLLAPAFLWYLATPLFMMPEPANSEFAERLALYLSVAAVFVWWFGLFTQRRVLERTPAGFADSRAQELTEELERDV